jgi:hypothetical protein
LALKEPLSFPDCISVVSDPVGLGKIFSKPGSVEISIGSVERSLVANVIYEYGFPAGSNDFQPEFCYAVFRD